MEKKAVQEVIGAEEHQILIPSDDGGLMKEAALNASLLRRRSGAQTGGGRGSSEGKEAEVERVFLYVHSKQSPLLVAYTGNRRLFYGIHGVFLHMQAVATWHRVVCTGSRHLFCIIHRVFLLSFLRGKITNESLCIFIETAKMCLADQGTDRPTMANVFWNLELSLKLQMNAEEVDEKGMTVDFVGDLGNQSALVSDKVKRSHDDINMLSPGTLTSSTSFGGRSSTTMNSEQMHPSAIFSQMMNPKGR
ncbi:unnamed protein product [Victoria cruziana]